MSPKSKKPNKPYIPHKHPNLVALSKKIEDTKEKHIHNINALSKSLNNHIAILSNFVSHDIKNSVQSIDSIISSNTLEELTEKDIDNLKLNLKMIRDTIDNLSKLAPYGKEESFEFKEVINAIELLNRENFRDIHFVKEIPKQDIYFHLSFQTVLQMINNVVINAVKALENTKNITEKRIKISARQENDKFVLEIYDNAHPITFSNPKKIFDYGVSSTGGSGIGLYHVQWLCTSYKGDIQVHPLASGGLYTKCFTITLPL